VILFGANLPKAVRKPIAVHRTSGLACAMQADRQDSFKITMHCSSGADHLSFSRNCLPESNVELNRVARLPARLAVERQELEYAS
jgi:hypothetical protein